MYRVCTDFQILNGKVFNINHALPLIRDCIQKIGQCHCEIMSVADLKDAYHTLRCALDLQKYCGITPFYISPVHFYLRLGIGLSVLHAICQQFIDKSLSKHSKLGEIQNYHG